MSRKAPPQRPPKRPEPPRNREVRDGYVYPPAVTEPPPAPPAPPPPPPAEPTGDLWLCGQYRAAVPGGVAWDFQGIFSSRKRAEDACRGPAWFIAPIKLDEDLPDHQIEFPGALYPRAAQATNAQAEADRGVHP